METLWASHLAWEQRGVKMVVADTFTELVSTMAIPSEGAVQLTTSVHSTQPKKGCGRGLILLVHIISMQSTADQIRDYFYRITKIYQTKTFTSSGINFKMLLDLPILILS